MLVEEEIDLLLLPQDVIYRHLARALVVQLVPRVTPFTLQPNHRGVVPRPCLLSVVQNDWAGREKMVRRVVSRGKGGGAKCLKTKW